MNATGNSQLTGNLAPITFECDTENLPIRGHVPVGLNGSLFRNGPNPQFPSPSQHWFQGDGMVHAFTLRDGRASYRNRWVRTAKWRAERMAGKALAAADGVAFADEGVANTNIVWHAGRLLALEEGHLPVALDPVTLETRGIERFEGALEGPFTAHPKIDPITGEMVFFGYSVGGPYSPAMSFGTIGADGRVKRFESFEAPYCSMVHDFAVTRRHVLFPILPLAGSAARLSSGGMPYAWEPERGSYVGLMRREQGVASLTWFRAENCHVFHLLNAWDEGGRILADVMQYDEPPLFPRTDGSMPAIVPRAHLVRWSLDPGAGTDAFTRATLDETTGEFPRIDDRRGGLRHRFGAFAAHSRAGTGLDRIVWLDLAEGRRSLFALPEGDGVSEPVFVPRHDAAAEGDGWLLAIAWRAEAQRSDLIVLDTQDIAAGPLATVSLPHRVPAGFHGNWVSANSDTVEG